MIAVRKGASVKEKYLREKMAPNNEIQKGVKNAICIRGQQLFQSNRPK